MTAVFSVSSHKVELAVDPVVLCPICMLEVPQAATTQLKNCKCIFCKQCFQQFLTVMVNDGRVLNITCPDGTCHLQGQIDHSEIEESLEKETFAKYIKLRFEREVELDPNRTFCPEVGCETICHVCSAAAPADSRKARPVHCHVCGLMFCSVCKAKWHGAQSCDEFSRSGGGAGTDGVPFSHAEDASIKRCPFCHVPIERNDGCAQMMCKRCKHVFCWYCLESLDEDFLLRHYDKGPCKNRLGHSRASVMWHRTQVVGIFAGFGVLMLLASPFLLLAAPCILCCKCKACHCCDDDDAATPDGFSYTLP